MLLLEILKKELHFGDWKKLLIMANLLLDNYMNESTKFDGENYVNWKFKLMTILEGNSLWDEPKPTVAGSIPIGREGRQKQRCCCICP